MTGKETSSILKRTVFAALAVLILTGTIFDLSACKDIAEQKTDGLTRLSSTGSVQADSSKVSSAAAPEKTNTADRSGNTCSSCAASHVFSGAASKPETASGDSCACENEGSSTVQANSSSQPVEKVAQQKQSSSSSSPVLVRKTITIDGMMCDECVQYIRGALGKVKDVKVESVEIGKAVVEVCSTVSNDALKNAVEINSNGGASGYTVRNIS